MVGLTAWEARVVLCVILVNTVAVTGLTTHSPVVTGYQGRTTDHAVRERGGSWNESNNYHDKGMISTVYQGNVSTGDYTEVLPQTSGQHLMAVFSETDLKVEINTFHRAYVILSHPLNTSAILGFTYHQGDGFWSWKQDKEVIRPLLPLRFDVNEASKPISIDSQRPGRVIVGMNTTSPDIIRVEDAQMHIVVIYSHAMDIAVAVFGWLYFVSWSVSFYPQFLSNWSRKSVVGMSFDYVAYSLAGFTAYFLLEASLFWIKSIRRSYAELHPGGVNPVMLNDVMFPLHAIIMLLFISIQCCIYERGGQTISKTCLAFIMVWIVFSFTCLILAGCRVIPWLTFLYWISYTKLFTTTLKYMPQMWMHYIRKTTEGWSIGTVLLDFFGGLFSLIQMLLLAANYDDWSSVLGNVTKLGLSIITCCANIFFFVQHFFLYKHRPGYLMIDERKV